MSAPNRNTLWARIFVDELARAGLRAVCISPGSRSTPLTLAFAENEKITVYSHVDERSGGFFALGMARASGEPVALVCTSGTATANFHPAIIEASQARVPLLVLTADRPHELRDSGANQTIDQVKMYGDHVRWFVDVAPPEADPPARTLRYLRTLADRALAVATTPPQGPVHLNFPFRKPLEPTPVPGDVPNTTDRDLASAIHGRSDGAPFTRISQGVLSPTAAQVQSLTEAIGGATRGLIVCGPRFLRSRDAFPQVITQLARVTGYPVLADPLSGVRFGPHVTQLGALLIAGYETFLQTEVASSWQPPSLILRFGAMPTSKWLQQYLASLSDCRQIAIGDCCEWHDASHQLSDYVWADPEITCRQVLERLTSFPTPLADPTWVAAIRQVERMCWEAVADVFQEVFFEGVVLADVVELLPSDALLYVSNSLPVRDLDQFAQPRQAGLRVLANRGASGIDGIVSCALGAAAVTSSPVCLVTGDLGFYHDLNGLLALRRCGVKATMVVINNDGGGIFHRLPIAEFDPPFTAYFVTPHGLDFEPAVRMYGAEYVRVDGREAFRQALQIAIGAETAWVIEVVSDRVQNHRCHQRVVERMGGQRMR